MISLPSELKAILKFPGYFYRESDDKLFSIKIGGDLRPLKHKKCPPMSWNDFQGFSGWELSKNGRKYNIPDSKIKTLLIQTDYMIPYTNQVRE